MIFQKREEAYHVLQPFLDKVAEEEKTLGEPTKKTLLIIGQYLVRFAPNFYTPVNYPSYSDGEKTAAKLLLKRYGLGNFCNLSPRYKKAILQLISIELAKEA